MNEVKNIPRLRFPEFSGDFESKIFDDIVNITRLAGYEYSSYWEEDQNEEIIALRGYNIGKGFLNLYNLGYISNELSNQLIRSRLFKNDIVYPCVGSIGNAVVIEENDKYHIQQNIAKITPRGGVYSYFISHFLMSSLGMREVLKFNATSSQPNVLVGSLRKFRINVPSLLEQQKIADFLTAVDKRIELLEKKKTLLETYKKGVIKKIFNQEIRFKEDNGNDFPDWEEKKLGEIGKIVNGITYRPNQIREEGILVLRSSNVQDGRLSFHDNVYISVDKYNPVKLNDILICVRNGSQRLIGKNAIINQEFENVGFGAFMTIYRSEYNIFFNHWFDSEDYYKNVHKNLGATINSINGSELKQFKVPFPSIKEQQKITDFLNIINSKIDLLNIQIDKSKTWKKGLPQKMFV